MSEKNLEKIEERLDVIIRLLASKSVEGKSQTESISELEAMGLERNLISEITGASLKVISVRLSEAKKKGKSKSKGKKPKKGGQSK